MRIVVDINHPAHVHFFKHFIWTMQKKGHELLITASDKDIACQLLSNLQFAYLNLGRYGKTFLRKLINIPVMDWKLYRAVKHFKPDIFLGLASVRAAHVAALLKRKCINFDDTENGTAEVALYLPFVHRVCTPSCYQKRLGPKQIRYAGYHELAYLHPDCFAPDPSILNLLGVNKEEKFVVMRFISWQAVHDIGHQGLSLDMKRKAVKEFSRYAKIFITSESPLPADLEAYRIKIPPERIHHALAYAALCYGESATMTSESAVLGTPAIFLDNVGRGYTDEEEKRYGAVFNFTESIEDQQKSIDKGIALLTTDRLKAVWQDKRSRLLKEKIDVTSWMIELVEKEMG